MRKQVELFGVIDGVWPSEREPDLYDITLVTPDKVYDAVPLCYRWRDKPKALQNLVQTLKRALVHELSVKVVLSIDDETLESCVVSVEVADDEG